MGKDDDLVVLHTYAWSVLRSSNRCNGNLLKHQEMGQLGHGIIVEVNLQCGRQVFFPSKQVLSYPKAQPLEIMSRDLGAAVSGLR